VATVCPHPDPDPDVLPCWTALSFHLRADAKSRRVALWRELTRVRALNLEPRTWAIPHDETGTAPISRVLGLVAAAGGTAEIAPARRSEIHLRIACRRLWDSFFNDLDELRDEIEAGSGSDGVLVETIDQLRGVFVGFRRRDLVGRDAVRAGHRLAECEVLLAARVSAFDALGDGAPVPRLRPRLLDRVDAVALEDGTVRYLAVLDPVPPVNWERAFGEFERRVYSPSPDRRPLEHGTFVFTVAPAERDGSLERIARRLGWFEQSLYKPDQSLY
jgi:hypothetical protein